VKIVGEAAGGVIAAGQPGIGIARKHGGDAGDDERIVRLVAGKENNLAEQGENTRADDRTDAERNDVEQIHRRFVLQHEQLPVF